MGELNLASYIMFSSFLTRMYLCYLLIKIYFLMRYQEKSNLKAEGRTVVARGYGEGEMRSSCLRHKDCQFERMKKFIVFQDEQKMDGGDCTV